MSVICIDSRDQFRELRANWDELYQQDPDASHFLSWRWLDQLYERRQEPVCVLAWRASSGSARFGAFLPLRRDVIYQKCPQRFTTVYRMAGNHWADYTGLLCNPRDDQTAIPEIVRYLCRMSWQKLYFDNLRLSASRRDLLFSQFPEHRYQQRTRVLTDNQGTTRLAVCPRIALPTSFEHYLSEQPSSGTRQKIRRFRRRIQQDARYAIRCSDATTRLSDLDRFERLWRQRWLSNKGQRVDRLAGLYRRMIAQGLRDGNLLLWCFDVDHVPVAMSATYVDELRHSVLFLVGARDENFTSVPSGLLLHAACIEWAIAAGMNEYDLLRGDERYKFSLGAEAHTVECRVLTRLRRDAAAELLEPSTVGQALKQLKERQHRLPAPTVEALFGQLLDSDPVNHEAARQLSEWQVTRLAGGERSIV